MKSIALRSRSTRPWARFCRRHSALFPSRAEIFLVRLMGGRVTTLPFIRHAETSRPLAIFWTLGRELRAHKFRRRVMIGTSTGEGWVEFGNDIHWGIMMDGLRYHNDRTIQQKADEFFGTAGWRVLHVTNTKMYTNPRKVYAEVVDFLND